MTSLLARTKYYHSKLVLFLMWFKHFSNQWHEIKINRHFLNLLIGFSFIIAMFSPVLAWVFSLLLLTLMSSSVSTFVRRSLGLNVVFTGALIIASRMVFAVSSDDFHSYIRTYNGLLSGNTDAWFYYNSEVGIPLLYFFHTRLFESAEPASIIFYISFLCGVLFLVWLEYFGINNVEKAQKALAIAASLLFFSFLMTSQVIRQMMAMIFILYALSTQKVISKMIFLFLGAIFHVSALPIFIIGTLLFKFPKQAFVAIIILSIVYVFGLSGIQSLYHTVGIEVQAIRKIIFHMHTQQGFTSADMYYVKFMLILIVLFLMQFLFLKTDALQDKWKYFALTFAGVYLIFLPLPLAPLRGTLIVNSILLGYLIFIGFKQYYRLFSYLLTIYIIYKLLLIVNGFPGPFELWHAYAWYGTTPFYYWIHE